MVIATKGAAPRLEDDMRKGQSSTVLILRRLLKSRNVIIGITILCFFILISVLAPVLAPYDYSQMDMVNKLQGPTARHLLGTDEWAATF